MDLTWDYGDSRQYAKKIDEGMPPLIISCAVTGGHQKSDNPNVPVAAEEQADDAAAIFEVGAQIIHIHGRQADDPSKASNEPARYKEIASLVRDRAPEILLDFTQTHASLDIGNGDLVGGVSYLESAPIDARPDIMALNPGPMTYRGGTEYPSGSLVTSFDDTERTANTMREAGIKPQVFIYHPGHLDILDYLIDRGALEKPYFVQLVFGQDSGIAVGLDSVQYMVSNLPADCIFQTCALDLAEIHVNVLAILLGGHVRTGMEDSVLYQRGEPARSNVQFVERVKRIAADLGRPIATPEETRRMLALGPGPSG